MRWILAPILLISFTATLGAAAPEDLWERNYAKKAKAVASTSDKSDDADFFIKVIADARRADNVETAVYLLGKVVEAASAQTELLGIAIDALGARAEFEVDKKAEIEQQVLALYKQLVSATKSVQAGEELVLKFLQIGDDKAASGDFAAAIALYREAQKAAVGLPIGRDFNFRALIDKTDACLEVQKQIRALPQPPDALKLLTLVRKLIEDLDEPRATLPFLASVKDIHLSVMVPAACQPLLTLKAKDAQALAEWYWEMAEMANPASRVRLLLKAKMYAQRSAVLSADDASARGVATALLGKVDAALAKQNISAAQAQQMLAKSFPETRFMAKLPADQCDAVRRAVKWTYSKRREWGHWDSSVKKTEYGKTDLFPIDWGGRTAIAVAALLMAGEDPVRNPKLRPAVRFLTTEKAINGASAVGLRIKAMGLMPDPQQYRDVVQFDLTQLMAAIEDNGMFGTTLDPRPVSKKNQPPRPTDLQQSYYAWMGLAEAAKMGARLNPQIALNLANNLLQTQRPDGAWPGEGAKPTVSPTKTVAAIGMLQAASTLMDANQKAALQDRLNKGLSALDEVINKDGYAANGMGFRMSLQQVAHEAKRREFGAIGSRTSWHTPGCRALLEGQSPDGSWSQDITQTAAGIIFLATGDAPTP